MTDDGPRVAVVGTGRMGAAMAGRIGSAGFAITLYNRTIEKARAVADQHGGSVAESAAAAAAAADVVLVSLADDQAARTAYGLLGDSPEEGLLAGLRPGTVVVDTSTIAPATVRELGAAVAETGAVLLDTPVSGSVATVQAGELTVMAGGDPAALEVARPVLETFAKGVVHLGEQGSGAVMKLAVNSIVHALNVALSEGLVLAEAAGVDREAAYDVIASSAVGAPFVQYKRAAFLDPDGTPVAFTIDLVAKDLDLAAGLATEARATVPQLAANRQVVADAIAGGWGAADLSAIAQYLRQVS